VIRFESVVKRYPGLAQPVLGDFSLEVPEGGFCVLLGRSGAGKSTALKLVNRLVDATSGRVLVNGADVREQNPYELRRGIGYVLQRIGLLPHLCVEENVALVPSLLGWSRARIAERVNELLTMVGLEAAEFRRRMPSELSGGQQQRVGVARALAANPRVLLMDEPFGALDPVTRADLRREVAQIQRQLGLTTIMVTHDVVEALLLADEVVVLDQGVLIQRGTPRELAAAPKSDFVARLLSASRQDLEKLDVLLHGASA
jgi:osmoprotectant transport system ATP-binding protein